MEEPLCTFLEWDTQFFGYRIARLNISQLREDRLVMINNWCAENEIDCLYFLASPDDPLTTRLAEDNAYRLQDVRMLFEYNLTQMELEQLRFPEHFEQKMATASDIENLIPFVQNAFTHTRFYYDTHFTVEQCNHLYETWLVRSIKEDFANMVMKVSYQGQAAAFISCSLNQETEIGSIGLIGVAENMRGMQLGFYMIQNSFTYFQQQGMKYVQVVTQARNISAQRLYQKCGFRTKQIGLWYHKWFT